MPTENSLSNHGIVLGPGGEQKQLIGIFCLFCLLLLKSDSHMFWHHGWDSKPDRT